jgi:GTP cyclohydrolase III
VIIGYVTNIHKKMLLKFVSNLFFLGGMNFVSFVPLKQLKSKQSIYFLQTRDILCYIKVFRGWLCVNHVHDGLCTILNTQVER